MEYGYHVCSAAPSCYLDMLDILHLNVWLIEEMLPILKKKYLFFIVMLLKKIVILTDILIKNV